MFKNGFLIPDKGKNSNFLILVFLTSRENQELFMSVACLDIRIFFYGYLRQKC